MGFPQINSYTIYYSILIFIQSPYIYHKDNILQLYVLISYFSISIFYSLLVHILYVYSHVYCHVICDRSCNYSHISLYCLKKKKKRKEKSRKIDKKKIKIKYKSLRQLVQGFGILIFTYTLKPSLQRTVLIKTLYHNQRQQTCFFLISLFLFKSLFFIVSFLFLLWNLVKGETM